MTISLQEITVDTKSTNGAIDRILRHISLVIGPDTYLGILGRNGAGKTTLARLLSGLERPTSGKVLRRPSNLRVIQVVQRPEDQFTEATVIKQIASFLPGRPDIKEALNFMDQVNLDRGYQHSLINQLSSGEQRLVAVACALATMPDCIVLDEPMVGLDNNNRIIVRNALRQLKANRSISLCLISHYPDDFIGLVDRLCILHETQIIYDGGLKECPATLLDLCLDAQDASVYRWLQAQAAKGITIPPQLYEDFTQQDLQAVLDRITL